MKSLTWQATVYSILFSVSLVHLLNDSIQSVIPAIFPVLQQSLQLSYTQIGWIAFTLNITASMFQPLIGLYTDAKPKLFCCPPASCFLCSGWLFWPSPPIFGRSFCRLCLLESVLRCFIRKLPGSLIWRPDPAKGWPNPSFKPGETSVRPWLRCLRP